MVYLHFPQQHTEEEEMLQKKYQKLKRKKKALQQLKAPKPEPAPVQNLLKSSSEAKQDAKEVAKKLLKSGAIHAIKVENKERQGFKRPQTLERRRSGPDKPALAGYHPFTASHPVEPEYSEPPVTSGASNRAAAKSLYESFVSSSKYDDKERDGPPPKREKPKQGNTVYVHGCGVTEDILRNAFSPIGKILNITMEMKKNCGFITFETVDCADKAIKELSGCVLSGIQVNVSLARNQPAINSPTWNNTAPGKKDGVKEKRTLVIYNDEDDIFGTASH